MEKLPPLLKSLRLEWHFYQSRYDTGCVMWLIGVDEHGARTRLLALDKGVQRPNSFDPQTQGDADRALALSIAKSLNVKLVEGGEIRFETVLNEPAT